MTKQELLDIIGEGVTINLDDLTQGDVEDIEDRKSVV